MIRGCTGKLSYPTRAEALASRGRLRARRGDTNLTAYHCSACGNFHLGRDRANSGRSDRACFDKGAKVRRYWELIRGGTT